jgi:RNA polymerase sigma-70 factor (ECF subfamily)
MHYQDIELMSRFTAGDVQAFSEVYKKLHQRIYFFCKNMVPADEAIDITANCFSKLWVSHTQFNNTESIQAFLFIAARNNCLNYLNHIKTRTQKEKEITALVDEEIFIRNAEIESDIITKIREEVEKLPEQHRQVLKLSYYDGYANQEIANMMGISEKTVRNLKSLALRSLKEIFLDKNVQVGFIALMLYKL